MVLGLGRPEVHERFPRLWAEHDVVELRLGGLLPEASAKLVSGVLGDDVAGSTVAWLVEQADGHPLYLEELIRAAARGGGQAAPETALAMVETRLTGLAPETRRALRAASVFGETFWAGGVAALFGEAGDVAHRLAELCAEELCIRRSAGRFAGQEELSFRHALVREAAYAMLTEEDRQLGHRLAGQWLERAGETDARVLAAHFEAGGDLERAAGWYRRAAEQAFEGNDLTAVLLHAARGVVCGAEGEALGALEVYQAEAHRWRGDLPAAGRHGAEAMSLLLPGSPLWLAAARESILASSGDTLLALVRAVQRAEGDPAAGSARLGALSAAHARLLAAGRRDLAAEILPAIEALAGGGAPRDAIAAAFLHDARAQHAFFAGDAAAFLRSTEAACAGFERAGDLRSAGACRAEIGRARALLGDLERAEPALRTALAEAARLGLAALAALCRHQLGVVLTRMGKLEEARAAIKDALEAFAERSRSGGLPARRDEGAAHADLATVLLLLGVEAAPERHARTGLDLLAASPADPPLADDARASALAALAEILLADQRTDEALEAARAALALVPAAEGGRRLDSAEARARLVHVEALAAAGDHAGARTALAEARGRLLTRAAALGDTVLRRSFLEGVPEHARTLDLARIAGIPGRGQMPAVRALRRPPAPAAAENDVAACLQEARRALSRGHAEAAISHAEQGMNHAAPGEVRAELRALMARAHGLRNAWTSAAHWAEQGLLEAAPGSRGWYVALSARVLAAVELGGREEIVTTADALSRVTTSAGAGPAVAVALASLAMALAPLGEAARAQDCFDRMERAGAPLAVRDPAVRAWMSRARAERARAVEEDPWTALRLDEASRESFAEAGDGAEASLSLALSGVDRWQLGAYERAEEALLAALEASGPRGHLAAFAGVHLAWTLADAGRIADAAAELSRTTRAEPCRNNPSLKAASSIVHAEILRRSGDPMAADREIDAALATPGLAPLTRTAALAIQAAVLLERGRASEALDLARRARSERESLRVSGFRDAFLRLVHVEALLATDDVAGARTPLSRAYARLLVHASKIGDPALKASFLERVPEHARTLSLARQWLGDVSDHAFR
jgi:tetratricopeptide (TPR) repeat protein